MGPLICQWPYPSLMDIRDGSISPNMQNVFQHSTSLLRLVLGNRMHTPSQVARVSEAEFFAINKSRCKARRHILRA